MATIRVQRTAGRNLSFATLCPFLYHTRTITTSHRHQRNPCPADEIDDEHNTLTFLQKKGRDVEARRRSSESTITPAEREIFENIMRKFGAKIDLPQEAPSQDIEFHEDSPLPIENAPRVSSTRTRPVSTTPTDTDIDAILSLFAPAEASQSFSTFSNADEEQMDGGVPSPVQTLQPPNQVRQAAKDSLQRLSKSLQDALASASSPPDLAIWRLLESDVFPLITLLRSERTLNVNPYQRSLGSVLHMDTLPYTLTSVPADTPLLPLITILYPAATLLTLRTYIAHFPASGFARALLPKIRSLGPASYLLAANVHFFNAVLHLHWTVYSDLRAIYVHLAEMRRNGVDYDLNTLGVLQDIKACWERDMEEEGLERTTEEGRSREWWEMKRQEDSWRRISRRWKWEVIKQLVENGQLTSTVEQAGDADDREMK